MAFETPLTIANVVHEISTNRFVLPSIQREYVWGTEQIEALFDSIMQDYPIGAFLFWEISGERAKDFSFYEFLKSYHEKNHCHNVKYDSFGASQVTAILDGQQRLTSIYIGLKGSYASKAKFKKKNSVDAYPVKKLYLNLIAPPPEDSTNKYNFKFLDIVPTSKKDYWFEVGKILEMNDITDATSYITDNLMCNKYVQYESEQIKSATNMLVQLYRAIHMSANISYYKEKSEELDKVLNIFIRVNSGGTVLSYSDLLLSIAAAQWEKYDAREEITAFVDEVNAIGAGFAIDKDFVLKNALVLSDFRNIKFKVDNFNKSNMDRIEENWDVIKKSIYQAFVLMDSFGYSKETLPSNTAVIPIAYYLKTINNPPNFESSTAMKENRWKIKKWLMTSLLKRAFSGTPDNVLSPIRDIISQNGQGDFPIEAIIEKFKGTPKSIIVTEDDIDEHLLKLHYGDREILTTMMILYSAYDYTQKFHIDHMYPKSKFNKKYLMSQGVDAEEIDYCIEGVNDIANLQIIQAIPNIEKQDKDFQLWFDENFKTDAEKAQYRMLNYIPEMEYTYENFLKFIDYRRSLIRAQLVKLLM